MVNLRKHNDDWVMTCALRKNSSDIWGPPQTLVNNTGHDLVPSSQLIEDPIIGIEDREQVALKTISQVIDDLSTGKIISAEAIHLITRAIERYQDASS